MIFSEINTQRSSLYSYINSSINHVAFSCIRYTIAKNSSREKMITGGGGESEASEERSSESEQSVQEMEES